MANTSTTQHTGNQAAVTVTPETLPAITHKGKPVVTTALLAKLYGTEEGNLQRNFQRNAERFEEGKHYHRLEGAELKAFKGYTTDSRVVEISAQARHLTLWTERGAARHAKMLDTDAAWDVYEKLEDCYFGNAVTESLPASIADNYRQVAFEGRRIRVLLRDGQPWFAAAQVASALGLRSSDRITRSALPHELCQTLRGKQAMNYLAPQAALRAGDYAAPEAGERWGAWFQRTLEGLVQQPLQRAALEAPGLSSVERFGLEQLLNTRLLLGFNAEGGVEVKAVKPEAMVVTPDRLAAVIGDNFVIGQQHLPEILSAVAGRMRSVA